MLRAAGVEIYIVIQLSVLVTVGKKFFPQLFIMSCPQTYKTSTYDYWGLGILADSKQIGVCTSIQIRCLLISFIKQHPVYLQILEAMGKDSGIPLQSLQVDGGMTANQLLMQLQTDLLGISVGKYHNTGSLALLY